ncbi:MAG: hypothetical protein FH748_06475 [Balneolaceae bacterium]|nr:hypothetical protein [Balneolaceae bacterium]
MDIKTKVAQMDEMISKGEILNAVDTFFCDETQTSDYGKVTTSGKQQMIEKMEGFLEAIENINGITHHHSIVDGSISASEFTFDFDMKDGSEIYWHEIIRRIWNDDGKVINEEYFDAQNQ